MSSIHASTAVATLSRHLSPSVAKFTDLVVTKGSGSWVWTQDNQKYLDFTCGIGATSTGHCHPKVVEAVQKQAASIVHAQQNIFLGHDRVLELVSRMSKMVPDGITRFLFTNSGSEAVENAVKLARAHTRKQNIIAFEGGFHGRTMGAMALTSSKTIYRQNFGPLMPGVCIAPYPYCLHCKVRQARDAKAGCSSGECCNAAIESLQWVLKQQTHPTETAAVIVEPIMGEGGFLVPPPHFLAAVRKVCDEHGIMLILDEVQSGVGRTGKWWGLENFPGARPDILVFAKGIASGYPLAGIATADDAFEGADPGTMGGTYGGNAVACAAGVATLEAIESEGMLQNALDRGQQLQKGLQQLSSKYPITEVRGKGLMVAAEIGGRDGGLVAEKGAAGAITKACLEEGMLVITAGPREVLRFLPALNITEQEMALAVQKLEAAFKKVYGS